jgi:hypothetical protein
VGPQKGNEMSAIQSFTGEELAFLFAPTIWGLNGKTVSISQSESGAYLTVEYKDHSYLPGSTAWASLIKVGKRYSVGGPGLQNAREWAKDLPEAKERLLKIVGY